MGILSDAWAAWERKGPRQRGRHGDDAVFVDDAVMGENVTTGKA